MNNFASHPCVGEATSEVTEGVGQSLNYSNQTEKKAGILLILETDADLKYWDRLRELVDALDEKGVPIQLWRIRARMR